MLVLYALRLTLTGRFVCTCDKKELTFGCTRQSCRRGEARLHLVQETKTTRSGSPTRKLELLDQVEYRLAVSEVEKEEIYNLRYRAYVAEGAIAPRADERL